MKLNIFLMIAICAGTAYPSDYVPHNPVNVLSSKTGQSVNDNKYFRFQKKINREGQYQPYYGYTIIAKIDPELEEVTTQIEELIKTSNLSKSYKALPADTYHTSIYTIFSCGNKPIPPVERWLSETGQTIPEKGFLPDEVLIQQNTKAMRILERDVGEPLYLKSATLTIGKTTISLTVELHEETLRKIENMRKQLVKVYEHPNLSMEPISEKLHITLAYAYGKKKKVDNDAWNQLEMLVRPLKTAKLMPPAVYLFESMEKYHPFQTVDDVKKVSPKEHNKLNRNTGVSL